MVPQTSPNVIGNSTLKMDLECGADTGTPGMCVI
jgi:hypothetical protein